MRPGSRPHIHDHPDDVIEHFEHAEEIATWVFKESLQFLEDRFRIFAGRTATIEDDDPLLPILCRSAKLLLETAKSYQEEWIDTMREHVHLAHPDCIEDKDLENPALRDLIAKLEDFIHEHVDITEDGFIQPAGAVAATAGEDPSPGV